MNTYEQNELNARRLNLIRRISEMENEELLDKIEQMITHENSFSSFPEDYPFAPSKEKLHSIIEQVLEDDRNGLMIDGEEVEREIRALIDSF